MQIESRTTAWWRNRNLMFLAMFLGAALWFGYDGYIKYPQKNMEWARQAIPDLPADARPNSRVTASSIQQIQKDIKEGKATSLADIEARLGKPTLSKADEVCWVGPAVYLKAVAEAGRVNLQASPSKEYSEGTIWWQKATAMVALAVVGVVALNLVRILRTHVVLDDSGLRYNSRHVPWDAMTGLRTDDYKRKGWVDLDYGMNGATRSMRLDSFHLDQFDAIVGAICERKGFTSPITPATADQANDSGPTQA